MTITIDLSPEMEAQLRQRAAEYGLDLAEYLKSLAERDARTGHSTPQQGKSLAEMLAGRVGVIDSSHNTGGKKSRLSEDRQAFGDYLERKRQEGRL